MFTLIESHQRGTFENQTNIIRNICWLLSPLSLWIPPESWQWKQKMRTEIFNVGTHTFYFFLSFLGSNKQMWGHFWLVHTVRNLSLSTCTCMSRVKTHLGNVHNSQLSGISIWESVGRFGVKHSIVAHVPDGHWRSLLMYYLILHII